MKHFTWLVLVLLVCGCSSLTPARVNVLADIVGQAAQLGAADWLAKHPEDKQLFLDVIAELGAVLMTDRVDSKLAPQSFEDAAVSFLTKLPTSTLRGKDGELYVTGDTNGPASLVVWDPVLGKGVEVEGEASRAVVRNLHGGLRRAMLPKPPMPPKPGTALALPPDVVVKELEGAPTNVVRTLVYRGKTNVVHELHVNALTLTNLGSTFDVTLNEHGVQQVNVRWNMDPNASYTVQRMEENKAWEGFASATNTNAVPTTCLWRTLWHHQCPVGNWRVVRR